MSENGADVSWSDVGKVLEDERSSVEDIQTDLARNNKGNICQSIDNCMTVFQRDPLLKGAIRKNELSGKIDIVGNLGLGKDLFQSDGYRCVSASLVSGKGVWLKE